MKKLNRRILSALLAFLLFLSNFPAVSAAKDDFAISYDGKVVQQVEFFENERITVSAQGIPKGSSCQWQIQIPGTEQWVDIHGQTEEALTLSKAMIASLMVDGSAYVCCAAEVGEEAVYTQVLEVAVKEAEPPVAAMPMATVPEATEASTEAPKVTEEPAEEPAEATEAPVEETTEATEAPVEETTEATEAPAEETAEATDAPVVETAETAEVPEETEPETAAAEPAETFVEEFIQLFTTSANAGNATDSTEVAKAAKSGTVTITINFVQKVEVNGTIEEHQVFNPYVATLQAGSAFTASVPVPSYIGYYPALNTTTEEKDKISNVNLNYATVSENVTITVYYLPALVNYGVRYFVQNIYNDQYIQYDLKSNLKGQTGVYPKDVIDIDIPGFTKLYNYPELIAADGSTEFQLYYDRNYYLYNFNLDGGYGVEPIYARYGTDLIIGEPTKAGYTFAGWDLISIIDENADPVVNNPAKHPNCDQPITYADGVKEKRITPRVCYFDSTADCQNAAGCTLLGNYTYKALWDQDDTTFTIIYWVQNANDDGYSYAKSVEGVAGRTGDVIYLDSLKTKQDPTTGALLDVNLPSDHPLYPYVTLDRQAIEAGYDKDSEGNLIDYSNPLGGTDRGVQLQGDGSSVFNIYFKRKEYTLKFVYARQHNTSKDIFVTTNTADSYYGYTYKTDSNANPRGQANVTADVMWTEKVRELPQILGDDVTTGTFQSGDYTYYYFTLTARYRENIADKWPKTADNNDTGDLGTVTNNQNTTFKCVGWCAHYQSNFADNDYMPSGVITGTYETLDDQILMDPKKTAEEEHILLAHWSNNEYLWEYRFYVGITEDEFEDECNGDYTDTIENPFINAASHPYWYRFKLVDSQITYSFSNDDKYQPRATIPGIRYTARKAQYNVDVDGDGMNDDYRIIYYYYRYEHALIFNNYDNVLLSYKTPFDKPTTPGGTDWAFQYVNGVKGEYQRAEGVWNLYESAYAVDYGISLEKHVTQANTDIQTAYPSSLEPDAYDFVGWYTGPNGAGERIAFDSADKSERHVTVNNENIWYNPTMPDDDMILFAYWKPKQYSVSFYNSYTDAISGTAAPHKVVSGITHGSSVVSQDIPNHTGLTRPSAGADFIGWFFINELGDIEAFDPAKMSVTHDMKIFAQWKTKTDTGFTVYYKYIDNQNVEHFFMDGDKKLTTTGRGYVASTKTFQAKQFPGTTVNGKTMNYYPTFGSTSIVLDADPSKNTVTFVYKLMESVEYTIQYWCVTEKKWVDLDSDGDDNDNETATTNNTVIDVPSKYKDGHLADATYKRLYLSSDKSQNIVKFNYTHDDKHARYMVYHMLQNVDDPSKYETEYARIDAIGDKNANITIAPINPTGFTLNATKNTVQSKANGSNSVSFTTSSTGSITVNLPPEGLAIYFYYDRNSYNYQIQYIEYGTSNLLKDTVTQSAKLESKLKPGENAGQPGSVVPSIITKDGVEYNLREGETNKEITIRAVDASQQIITYYYEAESVSATYIPITQGGAGNGGTCGPTQETVKISYKGSTPTPNPGFYFDGWYTDAKCKTAVVEGTDADGIVNSSTNQLVPNRKEKEMLYFYALFKPITLTISQSNITGSAVYEVISGTTTVARVMLTGTDSVTLEQIPAGTYTVREISRTVNEKTHDWTWNYANTQSQANVEVNATATNPTVSFDYQGTYVASCWLHNEARNP